MLLVPTADAKNGNQYNREEIIQINIPKGVLEIISNIERKIYKKLMIDIYSNIKEVPSQLLQKTKQG